MFIRRISLVLLLGAAVLSGPATAAESPWRPFGPGGGTVEALAVDPRDPAVVYAVGTGDDVYNLDGSLFKSLDGGATWKALGPANLMALDPEHPSTIYAGGHGLLRSDDGGQTWADISPRLDDEILYLSALTVAPGGVLLAVGGGQVLRSADGGEAWSIVRDDNDNVRSILVDPANPGRVYAMSDSGLSKSDDGGAHWTLAGQPGSTGSNFYRAGFALAPSAPKTLYVLLDFEPKVFFRSDDGAATWRRVGKAPAIDIPVSLLVDPRSPETVYAAGTGGVFKSTDGGRSWRVVNTGLPRQLDNRPLPVRSLAFAPSRPETLFAGIQGWGVVRSDNSGARWRTGLETGLNAALWDLQFHPLRPEILYLFQGYGRGFRSADGGKTWRPFAGAHARKGLSGLAFDLTDPDVLYGTDTTGTWKSADGGEGWMWLSPPKGRIALLGPQTLIAVDCGLQRSTDGGRTWRGKIPCDPPDGEGYRVPIAVVTDPKAPGAAYVQFDVTGDTHSFRNEVFRTRDAGATWTLLALSFPTFFAVAPSDFRILYALDEGSLLRSSDGGDSWKVVNRDLPSLRATFGGGLVVDSVDSNKLYIAADPLLVSHDGGVTFGSVDAPLEPWLTTGRFWTDSGHPGALYGASLSGGLFVGRFE